MSYSIRTEQPGDEAIIHDLVTRAFDGHPYSDGDEAHVIDRLRADGELLLSLVAVEDDAIIGQITYSPATLMSGESGWVTLGPVAVEPSHQGKGIARALIEAGEAEMCSRGLKGITLLGNPEIYARFGFATGTAMWIAGDLNWAFQVKPLTDTPVPATELRFARAFEPPAD